MIPFAVSIEGVTEEGQAVWVLAVDGERLLTSHSDGSLHWHPLTDCTFAKLVNPEAPQAVIPVQPKPQNGLVAVPNRTMRREMERNAGA